MALSLKVINKPVLWIVVVVNVVILYATIQTDVIFGGNWKALLDQWQKAIPAGGGLIIVGILNAIVPANAKARIVYFRWNNALPGSEAFSRHGKNDPRVDIVALEQVHGPFPKDGEGQNELWYALYKNVKDDPSVMQVHREFLLTRDYTCLSLMMLVLLGTIGLVQIPSAQTGLLYLILLALQFTLVNLAARNHGRRFVTTVLALTASKK